MTSRSKNQTGITRNVLTHVELLKLSMWFQTQLASIKSLKLQKKQVAEMATKELGFSVVERNVESVVEGIGCDNPFPSLRRMNGKPDFYSLQQDQHVTACKVEKLRVALADLFRCMGESIPAAIEGDWEIVKES